MTGLANFSLAASAPLSSSYGKPTGIPLLFRVGTRIVVLVQMWQHQPMQITLTSFALVFGLIFVIGAVVTSLALKNAPDGHEDADGFHYGLAKAKPVATPVPEAAWSNHVEREEEHAVLV